MTNLEKAEKLAEEKGLDLLDVYKKALYMYVDWCEECDIGYDNFPEEYEKYKKDVEEMEYIEGLEYMVLMEAIEQMLWLKRETKEKESEHET